MNISRYARFALSRVREQRERCAAFALLRAVFGVVCLCRLVPIVG